jgi:hypothetical protein
MIFDKTDTRGRLLSINVSSFVSEGSDQKIELDRRFCQSEHFVFFCSSGYKLVTRSTWVCPRVIVLFVQPM